MSDQSKSSNEDREHDSDSEEEISDGYRDLTSDGQVSDKKQHVSNNEGNASNQEPSPVPNTDGRPFFSNFLLKWALPRVVATAVIAAVPMTPALYAGAAIGVGLVVRDHYHDWVQCEDRIPNNSSPQRQIYEEVEKEEVKDNPSQKKGKKIGQKSYYDASGKSGLLCIIQLEQTWGEGNKKDTHVLNEFFKKTLGFDVEEYSSYRELNTRLGKCSSLSSKQYYCLVIYISGYENQEGVDKIHKKMKSIHAIKKRFGNEKIKTLAGVPKIIIVDTCRKGNNNKKGSQGNILTKSLAKDFKSVTVLPTTDSDCILIHATTNEICANIPDKGSVGLQGVMDIFTKNWEKDHLEEMLIDARMKVSTSVTVEVQKILEIETTLLKRLKFEKFERRLQVSK